MFWLIASALASLPWLGLRFASILSGADVISSHTHPYVVASLAGLAIVGAAYLLSVAAEVAQMDISRSLALAFLALVAILPEYAVDMVFAWKGGADPTQIAFATANMTGANRLLIGLFWPVVVFVFARKHKQDRITLDSPFRLEVFFLLFATAYSFTIPFRHQIHLIDFVLLAAIFFWYALRASKAHNDEVHLDGVAGLIADLGKKRRRWIVLALFVWAALGIIAAAEPFAESLVEAGASALGGLLGEQEAKFLAVQWIAPLASEFPELVVASLFAWRAMPESALGALISSKINQWTLLIGALPVVYVISHVVHGKGFVWGMPLDSLQAEEIFLTSAQSIFAALLLINLDLSVKESWALLVLFLGQFFIPVETVRLGFAVTYLILTVGILIVSSKRRSALVDIVRTRGAADATVPS